MLAASRRRKLTFGNISFPFPAGGNNLLETHS
jgi:hypothetical protein